MTDQIIVNAPLIQTVEIAQQSGALSVGNQPEQIVVSAPLVQSVSVASESVSVVTSGGPAAVAIFQGEGSSGLVPDPGIGDDDRVLLADGTWAAQSGSGGGGSDDQVAAEVPFTPAGGIAATDVQAAIEELDSEKAASIHQHSLSAITDAGALAAEDTVSSALVDDESITDAKLAHVATSTLKGRATTGTGDVETLSASQVRSILNIEDGAAADQAWGEIGGTLSAQTDLQSALDGKALSSHTHTLSDITDSGALAALNAVGTAQITDASVTSVKIDTGAVTTAKLAALAVTTAKIDSSAVTDVQLATNAVTSTKINDGAVAQAKIAANAVANSKLATVATSVIKGRATAGTGNVEDLSATQVRTILGVESGATADQTGAEIKSLYEAEADTNAFTDAEKAQLAVAGLTAQVYNSGSQSLLGSLGTVTVVFDTELSMDSGFTLTTSSEIECNFAGRVRISYHISGNDDTGSTNQRSDSVFWVERRPDRSTYSAVVGTETAAYHRNTREGGCAACVGTVLTVAELDKLRVRWEVSGTGNVVEIPAERAVFTIERI